MTDTKAERQEHDLALEYEIDAPPEKVWRAISLPAFREKWLPNESLAETDSIFGAKAEAISYRIRDEEPPFLESIVTFHIVPDPSGGTILRIVHDLADARLKSQMPPASNNNSARLISAA